MDHAKKILLVDAVTWSDAYPDTPLRNVTGWFRSHLDALPNVDVTTLHAESDLSTVFEQRRLTGPFQNGAVQRPPLFDVNRKDPPADIPATPRQHGGIDGVIISGSPRDAWDDDPVNEKLCIFIRECARRAVPVLGVCYGHQILARALGGKVARHPLDWEVGTTQVRLTRAGRASPLFNELPDQLEVLSSHRDFVQELPAECEVLITGDFTPVQGFHWRHKLFGVQFHPEMNPEVVRFLWAPRRERWRRQTSFDLDRALDEMNPTPHGPQILRNFVQHLVA